MSYRDTTVEVRLDRFNEIKRKFPEHLDNVLREGAERVKVSADARKPSKVPSSIKQEGNGFAVLFGSRRFFFGPFIEFGTVFQPARPFALPAAEAAFPGIKSRLKNLERLL